MEYLGVWGTLIHEKNLKSKISCQTPFKLKRQTDVFLYIFMILMASKNMLFYSFIFLNLLSTILPSPLLINILLHDNDLACFFEQIWHYQKCRGNKK